MKFEENVQKIQILFFKKWHIECSKVGLLGKIPCIIFEIQKNLERFSKYILSFKKNLAWVTLLGSKRMIFKGLFLRTVMSSLYEHIFQMTVICLGYLL